MAFNQKIARIAQDLIDAFTLAGLAVTTSYDASNDLYLTVIDSAVFGVNPLVKIVKAPQLGNNQSNPVTGLVEDVFTPHIIKTGFAAANQASNIYTIGAALTAGDKATIDGHDFLSIDSGAVLDQWNVVGTKAAGSATLLANLTAGDAVAAPNVLTINTHGFTAMNSGAAGDQFNLSGTSAVGTALIGVDLTAGDKITIDGHDFVSIDAGAALDQWNITGVQAAGTATLLANLTAGDAVVAPNVLTVAGHGFTAMNAGAAGDQFNLSGSPATATALIGVDLTAGDLITLDGHAFVAIDAGAALDQWNITGTQAVGSATLGGVVAGNTFVLNGSTFTAIAGATDNANNFHVGGSDALTAIEFAACVALSVDILVVGIVTAAVDGVTLEKVNFTAVRKGTIGNAITTVDGLGAHMPAATPTLTTGAVTVIACAASLAAAITGSITVGIQGVWTAANGGTATATISAVALGTLKNGTTFTQTGGHITVSGGGIVTTGNLDLTASAVNLAAAITASVTVGIDTVVDATSALAVVTLTADKKGTSGNLVSLAQTGANFTLSGAFLINGAVTPIACAASLAAAITGSVTAGIQGVWTAANGGTNIATITSVALGTLKNGTTLTQTGGHITVSGGGTIVGGALDLTISAANLAAAIVASVTVGISNIVTATSALAVVTLAGAHKGTSGNVALAQTGANFTLSGVAMVGGLIDLTLSAASLTNAINASVTAGIVGVVISSSALAVVTITAVVAGLAGNAITTTGTGAVVAFGPHLVGGTSTGTSGLLLAKILFEVAIRGTQVDVYTNATSFAVTDFVAANLVYTFRNIAWGNLVSM